VVWSRPIRVDQDLTGRPIGPPSASSAEGYLYTVEWIDFSALRPVDPYSVGVERHQANRYWLALDCAKRARRSAFSLPEKMRSAVGSERPRASSDVDRSPRR
jgi:hypothetical protein